MAHQKRYRKIQEVYQQAITGCDNQIHALEFTNKAHQQKILRLNEEINDLIANRHVVHHGCFDNVLSFIKKKTAEKLTHTMLFNVNIGRWKNTNDGSDFVTQTWRWLTNVMIQCNSPMV